MRDRTDVRRVEHVGNQIGYGRRGAHPIAVLAALTTYVSGRSGRGRRTCEPAAGIVDALDGQSSVTFQNVEPTGRR